MTKSKANYSLRCKRLFHKNVWFAKIEGKCKHFFSNVEEKPSSAGSRKEKEKDGLKSPVGELVEVKTSGYSKKWDLPITIRGNFILSRPNCGVVLFKPSWLDAGANFPNLKCFHELRDNIYSRITIIVTQTKWRDSIDMFSDVSFLQYSCQSSSQPWLELAFFTWYISS